MINLNDSFAGEILEDVEDYSILLKKSKIAVLQDIKAGYYKVCRDFISPEHLVTRFGMKFSTAFSILNNLVREGILKTSDKNFISSQKSQFIYKFAISQSKASEELNFIFYSKK